MTATPRLRKIGRDRRARPRYAGLDLSCVLVGDARLGGISATLCAWECLLRRGYDVDSLLFVGGDAGLGNAAYVERLTRTAVAGCPPPPPMAEPLDGWFDATAGVFDGVLEV